MKIFYYLNFYSEYAQVTKMLGNGRLEAMCFDGVKRLCHIRGKLRKKASVPNFTKFNEKKYYMLDVRIRLKLTTPGLHLEEKDCDTTVINYMVMLIFKKKPTIKCTLFRLRKQCNYLHII